MTVTFDERREYYTDPRVLLANERSLLSWFRLGTYLLGLAFLLAKLAIVDRFMGRRYHDVLAPMIHAGHRLALVLTLTVLAMETAALIRYVANQRRWHRAEDGRGFHIPAFFEAIIVAIWLIGVLYWAG